MSNLDDLSDEADRCGFWQWFMKWFVRVLRLQALFMRGDDKR